MLATPRLSELRPERDFAVHGDMPSATAASHSRRSFRFRPYAGIDHDSGVSAYAIGPDFVAVEFRHDGRYLYTYKKPGRAPVEAMKKLAAAGEGLATYINRHVRENYARRLT